MLEDRGVRFKLCMTQQQQQQEQQQQQASACLSAITRLLFGDASLLAAEREQHWPASRALGTKSETHSMSETPMP